MIDLASLWAFVQDWWFPILGYGVMGVVLIEAAAEALYTRRVSRKLKWFRHQVTHIASTLPNLLNHDQPTPNPRMDELRQNTIHFDTEFVVDARERMHLWYALAPLLGLMFTTMQLAVALPTAFEVIQNDPASFFRTVGVAVGTTAIGVLVTIIALISFLHLDAAAVTLARAFEKQRAK